MSWKELFTRTGHAAAYSKFRPGYPGELYSTIIEYLQEKLAPPFCQVIDVGCGSGQNTCKLASYFQHVLGYDISEAQIEEATKANTTENVQYRVGKFDNLFLPNESTDLVTCALAVHWFNPIEDFYKEVDRVLKPNGVIAVFGYGMPRVECLGHNTEELTNVVLEFYQDQRLQQFVNAGNREVVTHYENIALPYVGWKRVDSLSIKKTMKVGDLLGYLTSWSFYWKYIEQNADKPDPIDDVAKRYQDMLEGSHISEKQFDISWPIFLLIGRKP